MLKSFLLPAVLLVALVCGAPFGAAAQDDTTFLGDQFQLKEQWLLEKAQQYLEEGDTDSAVIFLEETVRLYPRSLDANMILGTIKLTHAEYALAARYLKVAMGLDSGNVDLITNHAYCMLQLDELDSAVIDAELAIAVSDSALQAYFIRGLIHAERGKYTPAEADFARCLHINPDFGPAYVSRAAMYDAMGKIDEALADCDSAIAKSNTPSQAFEIRSKLRFLRGDAAGVYSDISQAISLNPSAARLYMKRGALYMKQQQYLLAIDELTAALELDSAYADAYAVRGIAKQLLFNPKGAQDDIDAAFRTSKTSLLAYMARASLHAANNNHTEALYDYDTMLTIVPDFALANLARAGTCVLLGYDEDAIDDYTVFINTYPTLAMGFIERGKAYTRMNMYNEAVDDFSVALKLEPKDTVVKKLFNDSYKLTDKYLKKHGKKIPPRVPRQGTRRVREDPEESTEPPTPSQWVVSAYERILAGELDLAIGDYKEALRIDSTYYSAMVGLGKCYAYSRNDSLALEILDRAIRTDSSRESAYTEKGNFFRSKGWYSEALECYSLALLRDEYAAKPRYERGLTLMDLDKHGLGLQDLLRAVELDPNNPWLALNIGTCYRHLKNYDLAKSEYDRAIGIDSTKHAFYYERGRMRSELENYEAAVEDFSKAISTNWNNANYYRVRGRQYNNLREYEKAIADYDMCLALDSSSAYDFNSRGVSKLNIRRYAEASADFHRAATMDTTEVAFAYNRVSLLYKSGLYDSTVTVGTNAQKNFPQNWVFPIYLGLAYDALGQHQAAISHYNRAITLESNNVYGYTNRAKSYLAQNNPQAAAADVATGLRIDSVHMELMHVEGLIRHHNGDLQGALQYFNLAIEKSSQDGEYYTSRALTYLALGNRNAACDDLRTANTLLYFQARALLKEHCE